MKGRKHTMKRWKRAALAGVLGISVLMPAEMVWAAGPGETGSAAVVSGGPGVQNDQTSSGTASQSGTQTSQTNPYAWEKVNGVYQMPDGSAITGVIARGIDVSRWQGEINWSQVAADDVSFVMLGTRSKGAVDPYFHKNIQGAAAAGVKVGVYIYSLATTPEMAVEEADFVLNLIHDYPVSYPVAFDMEDSTQGALSKEELAAIANAFCNRISEAGYYPIIYANDNWLANKLDMSLMDYPVWAARYSARPAYQNPVMWQATSTGSVNGISGNVDIDFQFVDFTSVIPANTWRTINGNTYYYLNYQKQKNAWVQDGTDWYYMDGDGLASKGWLTLSGTSYYLDDTTGKMVTGWKLDDGKWYYFGGSGAMDIGWINDGGVWYYTGSDGVMRTGWLDEGGRRYYLNSSGDMAVGWTKPDGNWYYMDGSGVMQTGWLNVGGVWYYLNESGIMQTGWQTINGVLYYLDVNSGQMAANAVLDYNGTAYQADASGACTPAAVAAEGEETQAAGQEGTQTSGQDTAAAGPSTAIQVEMGPGWNL